MALAAGNPADLLRRAQQAIDQGKLNKAVDLLTQYTGSRPDDTEGYQWRGVDYQFQGRCDLAMEDYNHVLQMNANHTGALFNRGLCLQDDGQHHEALKDFISCQPH